MKIKHTALMLLLFIGAVLWGDPAPADTANRLVLTHEIVRGIRNWENMPIAPFFLSRGFFISDRNNASRGDINREGRYAPVGQSIPPIEFNTNDEGRLIYYNSQRDVFVVRFKDFPLSFRRNSRGRYECFSIAINARNYNISPRSESDAVLLHITTDFPLETNNPAEMLILSNSEPIHRPQNVQPPVYGDSQSYETVYIGRQVGELPSREIARQPGGRPSRYIDGQSSVTGRGIADYVIRQNPYVNRDTLSRLIGIYAEEAAVERINLDIAIAQMLYATNFLSNQRMASHNYGGLNWNGRFYNMRTGVRAHIQHLKGYASMRLNSREIVDPRYHILADLGYLGRIRTFERLYETWSPYNYVNYGRSIDGILAGLYRASY